MNSRKQPDKKSSTHIVVGVLFGALMFVVIVFVLRIFKSFAGFLIGVGTTIAISMIFAPRPNKNAMVVGAFGITQEQYDQILSTAESKFKEIKDLSGRVRNTKTYETLQKMVRTIGKIIQDVKDDPKDIKQARKFFDYYLETTIKILSGYLDLERQQVRDRQIEQTMTRIEKTFETMNTAFEKQLAQLMEDNVLDLDTELQVLNNTIKLEGLGDEMGDSNG